MSYESTSGRSTTHPTPPEVAPITALHKEISQSPNMLSKGSPGVTTYGTTTGSCKSLAIMNEAPGETTEVQYTRVRQLIRAERDGYRYKVSYHSSEARKEAPRSGGEIVVRVGEGRF